MNFRLILSLLVLALPALATADETSHKAAATKLVAKMNTKETMLKGFSAMMDPMMKQLSSQGLPPAAIQEVKDAVTDWFNKEMDFSVITPKLAEAYAQEFTEGELNQLTAFYETPLGQKLLSTMPALMQKGAAISQEQLAGKQADLQKRIVEIMTKYAPAGAGGAPGGSK
jgi:uncharacterized protein